MSNSSKFQPLFSHPQLFLKVPLCTIFLVKVPFYDNGTRDMCQESGEKEEYFMTSTYKQLSSFVQMTLPFHFSDG